MKKSLSSTLSSTIVRVRLTVLRIGFRFRLGMARVNVPAPSRLLLALLSGYGVQAMALPTGGQVVSGNVSIGTPQNGSLNVTQTSGKGIVNWDTFNVGSGEKVNFLQPGTTSTTLNRVVGNDASAIFGQINANGQVFLLNSNGILFAPGSSVNAAGLVASTLQLKDADFLAGNYSLAHAGAGGVENAGVIKAGFAVLAGGAVTNTGSIDATGGTAALVAGDRVTMNLTGSDVLSVSVDAPTAAALVRAGGIVKADGGQVIISAKAAGALLDTVVNVDGLVQARSIGVRDGKIVLDGGSSGVVSVTGTGKLDASGSGAGQTGGTVKVLGQNVGLFDAASIDVSGDAGGGVVRVGGDWHGQGADGDANATQAILGADASIKANAIARGNGGDVVLWSDDKTQFLGRIDARAGALAGNGGNVETSGHRVLQAYGSVDGSSAHGAGGTWLLDPNDITISNAGSTGPFIGGTFTSTDDDSVVNVTALKSQLGGGTNVAIIAASQGTNSQLGDITVDANINPNVGGGNTSTLTLTAQHDIVFTSAGGVNPQSGTINLVLNAGTDGNGLGTPGANPGAVTMAAGSSINPRSGSVTIRSQGDVQLSDLVMGSGAVVIDTNGGNVTQVDTVKTTGTVSIDTSFAGHPSGDVTLNDSANTVGRLVVTKADDVQYRVSGSLVLGSIDAASLTLVAGSAISQNTGNSLKVSGNTTATSSGSSINLTNTGNDLHQFGGSAQTTVAVTSAGTSLELGNVTGTALTATTHVGTVNGNVTQTAGTSLNVSGLAAINAGTGTIDVATSTSAGSFGATGSNVNVSATHDLKLDNVAASGNLQAASAGNISQVAARTVGVTGTATFDATGGGSVQLNNAGNTFGTFAASTTGDVSVHSANTSTLTLGDIDAHNLAIDTTAHAASLAQSGTALTITGAMSINAGTGGDVDVGTATSNIHSFGVTGRNVHVTTGQPLLLDNVSANTLRTTTAGTVSQSAGTSVAITADGTFEAGTGDVLLDNANNRIGVLGADTSGNVDVKLANATTASLGNIDSATLKVDTTAHGADLHQAGGTALTVTGATTLLAGSGDIDVGSTGSNLASFGASGGNVAVTTGHALALDDVTSSSLAVHGNGAITQSVGKKLVVSGAATFGAGAGPVTIQNANNALGSFGATTTGDVALSEAGALALGDVTAANLTVVHTGAGNVTQSGNAVRVTGTTNIAAGSGAITLGGNNNSLGTLAASAVGAVTVVNNADIALGAITAPTLSVTASGKDVTQGAGALAIGTWTAILTGTGSVAVGGATSSVGIFGATGHDVSVTSNAPAVLGDINVTGDLTVAATTGVTQGVNRVLHVGGAASFNLSSGNVLLANAGNTVAGLNASTTGNVSVASTSAIALGNVTAANLDVTTTNDNVSQASGSSLHIGSATTIAAGTASVAVGSATSGVGTFTASGQDVAVTTGGALQLGNVTTSRDLTTAAIGDVTQAAGTSLHVARDAHLGATGGNVTIGNAGNAFGSFGATTTGDVTVTQGGSLTLGNLAANNLSIANAGAGVNVGQKAGTSLNVATATTVSAGTGDVTIGGTTGSLGVLAVTAHDVTAKSGSALTLGNVTATGNLGVTTSGDVVQQAGTALHVAGAATFAAGAGNVTVGNAGNTFSTFGANTTGDVTVVQAASLALADIHAGNLSIDSSAANGNITQASGNLAVTGTTSLNAGAGDIQVGSASSAVATLAASGHDVRVTTGSPIALDAITATGDLAVVATGDITQVPTKTLQVSGDASFSAGAGNVSIAGTNAFGTFSAHTSGQVHVTQAAAVTLGNVDAGTLIVETQAGNGQIAQSAGTVVHVAGAASFDAGTGRVDLGQSSSNTFGSFGATAGTSVAVAGTNGLVLDNVTTGQLGVDVNAGGSTLPVTQSAGSSLQVSGSATIHANQADVTLNGANAVGTLAVTGHDVQFSSAAAGGQVLGAVTAHSLQVNAAGPVSQAAGGLLSVDDAVRVSTTSGDVTLTQAGNAVHEFFVSTPGAASLSTVTALQLGDVSAGQLQLITGGDLTQAAGGVFSVAGTTTLDAGTAAVSLQNATNDFGGAVAVHAQAIALRDANDLTVGSLTNGPNGQVVLVAGGALTTPAGNLDTGTGDLNLTSGGALVTPGSLSGANVTIHGQGGVQIANDVTASGNLVIGTDGSHDIVQAAAAVASVQGTTTLAAGTAAIDLEGANHFANAVAASGGDVTVKAVGPMVIHVAAGGNAALAASGGTLTVDGASGGDFLATGGGVTFAGLDVGGNLGATTTGGDIVQSGALSVHGTSALDAGAGHITLASTANDFGGVASFAGAVVTAIDANGLSAHATTTGDASFTAADALAVDGHVGGKLTANGAGVTFGTAAGSTTQAGTLAVASSGTIGELGSVSVSGGSNLAAGSHDITLASAVNDFGGTVTVSGGNVTLADASGLAVNLASSQAANLSAGGTLVVSGGTTGALALHGAGISFGATQVGGTLNAVSSGAIVQTAAVQVAGTSTLASGAASITLAEAGNDFGGGVTVSGATIDVEQAGALAAHLDGAGNATLRSGAALDVDGSATGAVVAHGASVRFGATQVTGTLAAQATDGAVTQVGDLAVGGASSFDAGTRDVVLDRAGNSFGGRVTATGANVGLTAAGDLGAHLGASAGATLVAAGAATVDGSTGTGLTITAASVDFGSTLVGGDLGVKTTGAPHAAVPSGGASPQAAGAGGIGQSGAVAVAGAATLDAGAGDIILADAANDFAKGVTATGRDVTIANAGGMVAEVTATGNAVLTSGTGTLDVRGTIAGGLTATGGSVVIDQASGFELGGALVAQATESSVTLGDVHAAGATVTAVGDVLLGGTLASANDVSITGGSIRGLGGKGTLDVAGGKTTTLVATSGDIGRTPGAIPGLPDANGIVHLVGATGAGAGTLILSFNAGQTAWFSVPTTDVFQGLSIFEDSALGSSTFGCSATACINYLGQTTSLADSVIVNILNAAAQDAADAAFGTENLDVAIRKGYITAFGRVPPGIDEIAGDLGSGQCDSRVTSSRSIAADKACPVKAK